MNMVILANWRSQKNDILGCAEKTYLVLQCYPNFFGVSQYIEQENMKFGRERVMYAIDPPEPRLIEQRYVGQFPNKDVGWSL